MSLTLGRFRAPLKLPRLVLGAFALLSMVMAMPGSAHAIPSFARQTELPCSSCHTIYPQLTPLGREFKLKGYTMGTADVIKQVSAFLQTSFTHTTKDQTGAPAPHFSTNDNLAVDQISLFYGGRITNNVGVFLQGTYDGVAQAWAWDMMDVRFADETSLAGNSLVYGLTLNNNPSVQDLWNTTPAWGFPFDGSPLAPGPAAATLIEGGLGQIAIGGSAYMRWNNHLYMEAGLYHMLSRSVIQTLGVDPSGTPKSNGVAPYWRLTWEQQWGRHDLTVGTFGLHAALFPERDTSMGTDHYTDLGFDAQYGWTGDRDNVTARFSLIREIQKLRASQALGLADNTLNHLNSLSSSVTYTYDGTVGVTAGIGHIWGNRDATLYGTTDGSPDTTSLTFQLDYLPFNKTPLQIWVWFNPKLTAQYVHYARFDGSTSNIDGAGRKASDNDTFFLSLTLTI
jgi:hypothetical protein